MGFKKKKTSKVTIQDHLFFYYLIRPLFIDYINREGKKKTLSELEERQVTPKHACNSELKGERESNIHQSP